MERREEERLKLSSNAKDRRTRFGKLALPTTISVFPTSSEIVENFSCLLENSGVEGGRAW